MKLLIVTPIYPPEIGGPATYVAQLASRLSNNHKVHVIAFSNHPETRYQQHATLIPTLGNSLIRQIKLFIHLIQMALKFEIIYSQGTLVVGVASLIVSKLLQKRLIVKFVGDEIWETAFNSNKTTLMLEQFYLASQTSHKKRLLIALHRLVLHHSHAIIVPSHYLKSFLVSCHRVKPGKIHVISNAVKNSTKRGARRSKQLITVGRLVKTKHVDVIIRALKSARQKNPWTLLIVGDGPDRKNLEQLVTRFRLQASITFTGSLPESDVGKLVAGSAKLILMSSYEGQSHTLLNALTRGTPIIASDIPPNRELLKKRGILVALNNPGELAKAINQPQKSILSLEFGWDTHITKFVSLCNTVL